MSAHSPKVQKFTINLLCYSYIFWNVHHVAKQYESTIFMGDVDYGRLCNFKLNEDRTGLADLQIKK